MDMRFDPISEAAAREILAWRYDTPYDIYNANLEHAEESVAALLDQANHYFVASDEDGRLVGYCCFGPDARVPGGDYRDTDALDIGLGMRPDLTGRGNGLVFVGWALAFGRERLGANRFRLTVAEFNRRAIRVYERAGFVEVERFRRGGRPDDLLFVLMVEGR
jgi:[ribosomal protein S18]-alanine N-acetyltransferase